MKKMTRTNLKELTDVLEEIRKTDFPDIPAEIIEQIVSAQYDNQDDRPTARIKTMQIVSEFLQSANTAKN